MTRMADLIANERVSLWCLCKRISAEAELEGNRVRKLTQAPLLDKINNCVLLVHCELPTLQCMTFQRPQIYLSSNLQKDFFTQGLWTRICLFSFYQSHMVVKLGNETVWIQILPPRSEDMWPSISYLTSLCLFPFLWDKDNKPLSRIIVGIKLMPAKCLEKCHLVTNQ